MQRLGIAIILCVGCAATGCTSRILRPAALSHSTLAEGQLGSPPSLAEAARPLPDHPSNQDDGIVWAGDEPASEQAVATDEAPSLTRTEPEIAAPKSDGPAGAAPGPSDERPPLNPPNEVTPRQEFDRPAHVLPGPSSEQTNLHRAQENISGPKSNRPAYAAPGPSEDRPAPSQSNEEILTPQPDSASDVVPGAADDDQDRFAREVSDVRLDIRPPQGPLPPDLAAEEAAKGDAEPVEEPYDSDMSTPIICSFNPWTICYRPLYFEDIQLERYGRTFGIVQPGVSAARFFCSVPLLPYKMVVRPPRSCECSNGFSRRGDQPLPGYGARILRLDAAAVEAAFITGLILLLP